MVNQQLLLNARMLSCTLWVDLLTATSWALPVESTVSATHLIFLLGICAAVVWLRKACNRVRNHEKCVMHCAWHMLPLQPIGLPCTPLCFVVYCLMNRLNHPSMRCIIEGCPQHLVAAPGVPCDPSTCWSAFRPCCMYGNAFDAVNNTAPHLILAAVQALYSLLYNAC